MIDAINIHQLNKARQSLYSYEHKRNQLQGLNDLSEGLEILSEDLENINIDQNNHIEWNLLTTYRRDSLEWIRKTMENCRDVELECQTLNYCREVIELFEDCNEVTGPDANMHDLKLTILKRRIICRVDEGDRIVSNIENMQTDEREKFILILNKLIDEL